MLVCVLQVLPPLPSPSGRERSVCLEYSKVTAEEQLGQRVVGEDLHRIDRKHLQVPFLEEARELATDPPVPDRVGVRQDDGSRGLLVWMVDDRVSQSKSKTAIRPPGRVTRTISASARSASGRCSRSRAARHTSNVSFGKGSACTSPTSKLIGR